MRSWSPATVMVAGLAVVGGCATGTDTVVDPRITVSAARPASADEDIFNAAVMSALAPGMIVTVRVTPAGIELQHAYMMLVPKTPRAPKGPGDQIIVTAFNKGTQVSQTAATDPVAVFLEGKSVARNEDRTVSLAITTPSLVDTLEIRVTSIRASQKFDVAPIMSAYCVATPAQPACRGS
jgi:hypothetical protein